MHFPVRAFTAEGRFAGSYVYFLCCQSEEADYVYIKIGMSDVPTKRLYCLVNECALKPVSYGSCNVRSRKIASQIETMMHRAFAKWRVPGEWYRFHKSDKSFFQRVRDEIIEPFRDSMWPARIETHGVSGLLRAAATRGRYRGNMAISTGSNPKKHVKASVSL